jgi:hypothetical protein
MSEEPVVVEKTPTEQPTSETPAVQSETPSVQSETPAEPKTPAAPAVDPNAIAEAVTRGMQQAQQSQQSQLSEEEIQQRMNVWNPDEQLANSLREALTAEEFDPNNVTAAMSQIRDGLVKQLTTYVQYYGQYLQNQMNQQYQPMMEQYQQQQMQQRQESFYKKYPGLKQFNEVMPAIAQAVKASGQTFNSDAEQEKALVDAAVNFIRKTNPNFSAEQAKGGGTKPANLSFGGQQNAGNQQKPTGKAAPIWG